MSMRQSLKIKQAVLVYQVGIANIFVTDGGKNRRIYRGDFRTAESIARGLGLAGTTVQSAACNMAGDITLQCWTDDLESAPFSDKFSPVSHRFGQQWER